MAVRYDPSTNHLDIPQNVKVGTKRYLAPEVLADTINTTDFESFKRADIYALGLVLWEICQRQRTNPTQCTTETATLPPHRLPYSEFVGSDPSLEDMRKVVCEDNLRPNIPNSWSNDPMLSEMTCIMQECWYESAAARLTAIRVKKNVDILQTKYRKIVQLSKINEANSTAHNELATDAVAKKNNTQRSHRNVNFAGTNQVSCKKSPYNKKGSEMSQTEDSSMALLLPQNNQNQKADDSIRI